MADARLAEAKRQGYEPSDARVRTLLLVVAVSVVIVVMVVAGVRALIPLFESLRTQPSSPPVAGNSLPPEPRLDARPAQTLLEIERHEDEILGHYAWVDRDAGVARIPIEQAMELLAARGWPPEAARARPENEAAIPATGADP